MPDQQQKLVLLREPRPKRKRSGPTEFSIPGALARADEIFRGPCAGHLPRIPGRGELVARFVLPLELCLTTNALLSLVGGGGRPGAAAARMSGSQKAASHKERVFKMLALQHPIPRAHPLPGRPMLRIVRFSTKEPDDAADGMKIAKDFLRCPVAPRWDEAKGKPTGGRKGLGFLVDDAMKFVETVRWWEKVPPGSGFGLLEIFSGDAP